MQLQGQLLPPRRHGNSRIWIHCILAMLILWTSACVELAAAEDGGTEDAEESSSSSASASSSASSPTKSNSASQQAEDDADPEKSWGHYYDPKNEFCGEYDCYKILGFDYESFGRSPPDSKMITQSYRMLSRRWHPDKNRGRSGAEERFVKINKAYEVLTDKKRRTEYDFLRDRPDEYISRYGSNVLFHYAPKSDVTIVGILLLVLGSVFTWYVQKQKWQTVADRLVKISLDGLGLREGGTEQSLEIRERALEILAKKKEEEAEKEKAGAANGAGKAKVVSPSKKRKMTKKELKDQELEELRPIIAELVKEILDFGSGFHQPTWRDLLVTKLAIWPVQFAKVMVWQLGYWSRRLRKLELTEEERMVLTRRAVGEVTWDTMSDEDRAESIFEDLWVTKNLEDWRERQEVKKLGPGYQKRYNRWKKKQGSKLE